MFSEHPASVGETYAEHMRSAFRFGVLLLGASIACLVHGILPWVLKTRGSETVRLLYDRMINDRRKAGASRSNPTY
jgi:hypothetical protein